MVARRLNLISENPCRYIHMGSSIQMDEEFKYFTLNQIKEIASVLEEEPDVFVWRRNLSIVYLMSIEGLRNVEMSRMNDEEIDGEHATILIHGNGHEGIIYPSQRTMDTLRDYLSSRLKAVKEYNLPPAFVSNSNRSFDQRLSRNGIRKGMDKVLVQYGYKQKRISCHVFRHSCGTNLYAATKDLRIVQKTLRQRDPKGTARYAHVQQRTEKRYTNMLDPEQ